MESYKRPSSLIDVFHYIAWNYTFIW